MTSAPDGVLPISICYISAHARCSWRIKSDRFMRSTGSGFRLELRGICYRSWADLESAGRHAALSVLDVHGLAPPLPPLWPMHRAVPGAPLDRRRANLADPVDRPGEWCHALPRTQNGRQLLDVQ